jgi:hypothetical protein
MAAWVTHLKLDGVDLVAARALANHVLDGIKINKASRSASPPNP